MKDDWTIEISNQHRWYDIDLKNVWRYRDLIFMYFRRDFVILYKQTIFGPLWFVIQPILTTIIYMFVFGGLAGISTDGVPQPLFYISGIMLWNYFDMVFYLCSVVFTNNSQVFGKVYFPRLVVPMAYCLSGLVRFGIQLALFLAVYFFYGVFGSTGAHFTWALALLPLILLLVTIIAMAGGLIISSMTTKYRDLSQLVSFGVQLLMYASPVIYPLSAAPEKYRDILMYNPLSPLFEALRYGFMGCGSLQWGYIGYSFGFALVLLAIALVMFSNTERNFMDTV